MKRLREALCNPFHVFILLIVAWVGTAVLVGDALGLIDPDYRALIFAVVFIYWLGVVLGLFRSWPGAEK